MNPAPREHITEAPEWADAPAEEPAPCLGPLSLFDFQGVEPSEELWAHPRSSLPTIHRLACGVLIQALMDLERGDGTAAPFLRRDTIWHRLAGVDPSQLEPVIPKIKDGRLRPSQLFYSSLSSRYESRLKWKVEELLNDDPYLREWRARSLEARRAPEGGGDTLSF